MKRGLWGRRSTAPAHKMVLIQTHQRLIRINHRKIRRDCLRLLRAFTLDRAELGILFVNDARMKRLNSAYRGIHKSTDVLAFPMYASGGEMPANRMFLLGDIVINIYAVKKQSTLYGVTFSEEVRRLLIHGFLHLLGYDHEQNRYQAKKMRNEERRLHHALETLD